MHKKRLLSVIMILCLLALNLPVQAEEADNSSDETQKSEIIADDAENGTEETDDEAIQSTEQPTGEEAVQSTEQIVETESVADGDASNREKNNIANSWRFENGQLLQGNSKARYVQYNTWPQVSGSVAQGVDVSHWNGNIDWYAAKNSGVDYAIIACGWGGNSTSQDDSYWRTNAEACARNGIPFGTYLYSYARTTEAARSEAEHVLRQVRGYNLSYPIYYDLEENDIRNELSREEIANIAQTFCDIIESAGYTVGIYANTDWFTNYLTHPKFEQWERWVAQYNSSCLYQGSYRMWQCSSEGRVNGFSGYVDLNVDYGAAIKKVTMNDGTYCISTGLNGNKILSVANNSKDEGANIVISNNSNVNSQQRIEVISVENGYYKLAVEGTGKVISVSDNSTNVTVPLQQKAWTGADGQLWRFVDAGDGYHYLESKLGTYIDVKNADSSDGNLVQTYTLNKSSAQKWKLSESDYRPLADGLYTIASNNNSNQVLDIANASIANGANVQLYTSNSSFAQQFSITYSRGGYYKIAAENSSKVLDVLGASKNSGVNVQQYAWNGSNAQLWKFVDNGDGTYSIKSKLGTTLAIADGSAATGTNVRVDYMDLSGTQKWQINKPQESALKNVADGTYVIKSPLTGRKVFSTNQGNVKLNLFEAQARQKFDVQYVSDGYYKIINQASGKALDVQGGSGQAGANLQEYGWNNSAAQLWRFGNLGGGKYYIKSKLGTVIDLSSGYTTEGNNIQLYSRNGSAAQTWELNTQLLKETPVSIEDGTYTIQMLLEPTKVLDIANGSISNTGNVQLYDSNNTSAQRVEVKSIGGGYYRIINERSSKVLDVKDGSNVSGANVQQYEWNNSNAQKWQFISTGDGGYYIKSILGPVLDVAGGIAAPATNVQVYTANESNAQKWNLKKVDYRPIADGTYELLSGLNAKKVMDLSNGVVNDGGNIQLYDSNGTEAQKYKVSYVEKGFYKIENVKSKKVLDVSGESANNGVNLQQYSWNGSDAQLWKFIDAGNGYYFIRSKLGKTIDVAGGVQGNGTNIQLYSLNGSNAQKWKCKGIK